MLAYAGDASGAVDKTLAQDVILLPGETQVHIGQYIAHHRQTAAARTDGGAPLNGQKRTAATGKRLSKAIAILLELAAVGMR
jgi:hypothetical protein